MKRTLLVTFIIGLFVISACTKKNLGYITRNGAPTTAEIIVHDTSGSAVVGKQVIIYSFPGSEINEMGFSEITGSNGSAHFDFSDIYERGSVGVATLFVAVLDAPNDTMGFKNANDKRLELLPEDHVIHNIVVK